MSSVYGSPELSWHWNEHDGYYQVAKIKSTQLSSLLEESSYVALKNLLKQGFQ